MNLISATGYFGIVALMFIENIFPPIPSELIMPLAGFMAVRDQFSLFGIILAGTIGSVLGALPLYYAGRKIGEQRIEQFAGKYGRWFGLSRRDIERADQWFDRHGGAAVLLCRLIPGIRSLISVPAGINQMNIFSFLFFTAVGSGIWTTLLAYAGYFLGSNFREIEKYLDIILYIVLGLIVLFYIFRILTHKERADAGLRRQNRA